MKTLNGLWRGIAAGGLTLALAGIVGSPITACAAGNSNTEISKKMTEQRQAMRAMHEKMLAQAKADDAALQKMVAELNKAPEARKADLEAAILSKLVADQHQRLGEWETLAAHRQQFEKEHMTTSTTGMSTSSATHAGKQQIASGTQK